MNTISSMKDEYLNKERLLKENNVGDADGDGEGGG